MQESILRYRKFRFLWLALAIGAIAIAAYALHDPQEPPSGGTGLGYFLGVIGALMIVWLMWFGVRKRQYASTRGTVQGWLSAHIYIGLALLVVVTLHTGFQFGLNVHTLAYLLMVLVIISGLFGVYVYSKYPERLSRNREDAGRPELLGQIDDIDSRARRVARDLPTEYGEMVVSGINRTAIGGSGWAQLRGLDRSQLALPGKNNFVVIANPGQEAALDWLAEQQSKCSDADVAASIAELSALLRSKRSLLQRLREDIRLQALLEVWLYVHVPLAVALMAAALVHIFSVFIYW